VISSVEWLRRMRVKYPDDLEFAQAISTLNTGANSNGDGPPDYSFAFGVAQAVIAMLLGKLQSMEVAMSLLSGEMPNG
jgi:hypothetical protein